MSTLALLLGVIPAAKPSSTPDAATVAAIEATYRQRDLGPAGNAVVRRLLPHGALR